MDHGFEAGIRQAFAAEDTGQTHVAARARPKRQEVSGGRVGFPRLILVALVGAEARGP